MTKKRHTAIGPLGPGSRNVPHFVPPAQNFAAPTRVTNSMQPDAKPGELVPRPYIRPGACHAHIRSLGTGC